MSRGQKMRRIFRVRKRGMPSQKKLSQAKPHWHTWNFLDKQHLLQKVAAPSLKIVSLSRSVMGLTVVIGRSSSTANTNPVSSIITSGISMVTIAWLAAAPPSVITMIGFMIFFKVTVRQSTVEHTTKSTIKTVPDNLFIVVQPNPKNSSHAILQVSKRPLSICGERCSRSIVLQLFDHADNFLASAKRLL